MGGIRFGRDGCAITRGRGFGSVRWTSCAFAGLVAVGLVGAGLSGCAQPAAMDLAENSKLYVPTGYAARQAVDRAAYLPPVIDQRGRVELPEAEEASARALADEVRWMGDGYWERPLAAQLDVLLRRELEDAELVTEIDDEPPPAADAVLLQVVLKRARAGRREDVEGRQSLADIVLELKVYGPAESDGGRTLWLEEDFTQSVGSSIAMQPPRLPETLGRALQGALAQLLQRIDESNVMRSGMPMSLDEFGTDPAGSNPGTESQAPESDG